MEIVIVNWPDDCLNYLHKNKNKSTKDFIFVALHSFVKQYLKDDSSLSKYQCREISEFITNKEIIDIIEISENQVDHVIRVLDKEFSKNISKKLQIPQMDYFKHIYRYHATLTNVGLNKIKLCLENLLRNDNISKLVFYDSKASCLYKQHNPLDDLLHNICTLGDLQYETIQVNQEYNILPQITQQVKHKQCKFISIFNKIKSSLGRRLIKLSKISMGYFHKKRNILLLNPLYDLDFLKYQMADNKLMIYQKGVFNGNQNLLSNDNIKSLKNDIRQNGNDLIAKLKSTNEIIMLKLLLAEFDANDMQQFNFLKYIINNKKFRAIDAIIWGNSPVGGISQLVVKYFLMNGTPVIGMQHGESMGIHNYYFLHFFSDYCWCTHYLTYGFDKDDLKESTPSKEASCKFLPVGSTAFKPEILSKKAADSKPELDIFYPMTNNLFFSSSHLRMRMDLLHEIQEGIIDYLEGLNKKVLITPFPAAINYKSAFLNKLNNLKNCIISTDRMRSILQQYKVRCTIIDLPSTPLYEVLGYDTEIFCIREPVAPFNQTVENMLKNRVHLYNTSPELTSNISLLFNGQLQTKQNGEFYKKHVYCENPETRILKVINSIICENDNVKNQHD